MQLKRGKKGTRKKLNQKCKNRQNVASNTKIVLLGGDAAEPLAESGGTDALHGADGRVVGQVLHETSREGIVKALERRARSANSHPVLSSIGHTESSETSLFVLLCLQKFNLEISDWIMLME
jgi:hypothetical protein